MTGTNSLAGVTTILFACVVVGVGCDHDSDRAPDAAIARASAGSTSNSQAAGNSGHASNEGDPAASGHGVRGTPARDAGHADVDAASAAAPNGGSPARDAASDDGADAEVANDA